MSHAVHESKDLQMESAISAIDPEILGARVRRARLRLGISIRDLAQRAGIDKNSILRLEQGRGTYPSTILKVCDALSLHIAGLVRKTPIESEAVAVHHTKDDRWFAFADVASGLDDVQHGKLASERHELLTESEHALLLLLRSRLTEGRLLSNVIELYGASPVRSHVGEEFVYCLSGTVCVTIGASDHILEEGDSLAFWSAEEHVYSPAQCAIEAGKLPVRILSVRMDDKPRKA